MFIKILSIDNWIENRNLEKEIANPGWQEIRNAISELNERERTLICLHGESETHMCIGGGNGQYVCYATYNNDEFYNLIDLSEKTGIVEIIAGGQLGEYPAKMCVDINRVLTAAKHFSEEGKLNPECTWEID
jgi:hypothetical protein